MTFLDFVRLVRRGLWFIVALVVLGGVVGYLVGRAQPTMFSTSATLLVTAAPSRSPAEGQSANLLAQSRAQLLTQLAVSDDVLTQVRTRLRAEVGLDELRQAVTATSTENTNFTTISASARSAQGAVDLVTAVVGGVTRVGEGLDEVSTGTTSSRTIRITEVSSPQLPQRAYSPQPRNSLIAGLAVGLALALIALTLREVLSQRVRGANDVRALELGFPIAVIERSGPLPGRRGGGSAKESYRYLRSTLLHALGRRGLIAVTSTSPRTSGGDLGRELGQAVFEVGSSVLVVDARLDRGARARSAARGQPRIRRMERATLEAGALDRSAQRLQPSPTEPTVRRYEELSNETEALARSRGLQALADVGFAAQIRSAASAFDFAVVLLPSMADCAEAAAAAASADAAVLQIDAGTTRRGEVLLAHQRLRASGVREVVGAVVGASRMDVLPSSPTI